MPVKSYLVKQLATRDNKFIQHTPDTIRQSVITPFKCLEMGNKKIELYPN